MREGYRPLKNCRSLPGRHFGVPYYSVVVASQAAERDPYASFQTSENISSQCPDSPYSGTRKEIETEINPPVGPSSKIA